MTQHTVHMLVTGHVQGVGFRFYVRKVAEELGITGWTRNLATGEVEVLASGEDRSLRTFISRLTVGPSRAQVHSVKTEWRDEPPSERGFLIR